jgi:hypothetical protein
VFRVGGYQVGSVEAGNGDGREMLQIRVAQESRASDLAGELAEYARVEVRTRGDEWEVALGGAKTDRLVAVALEAVQRSLDGDPSSTAQVLIDGREYRMHAAADEPL